MVTTLMLAAFIAAEITHFAMPVSMDTLRSIGLPVVDGAKDQVQVTVCGGGADVVAYRVIVKTPKTTLVDVVARPANRCALVPFAVEKVADHWPAEVKVEGLVVQR